MHKYKLDKKAFQLLLTSGTQGAKISRALIMFFAGMGGAKLFGARTGTAAGFGGLLSLLGYNTHKLFAPKAPKGTAVAVTPEQATLSALATNGNGPFIPGTDKIQVLNVSPGEHLQWKAKMLQHGILQMAAQRARRLAADILRVYKHEDTEGRFKLPQRLLNWKDKVWNAIPGTNKITQEYLDAGVHGYNLSVAEAKREIRDIIKQWSGPSYDYLIPLARRRGIVTALEQQGYPTKIVQLAIAEGGW